MDTIILLKKTKWSLLLQQDMQMVSTHFLDGAGAQSPWLLPNAGGTGYYRFSLSERLWQDLTRIVPKRGFPFPASGPRGQRADLCLTVPIKLRPNREKMRSWSQLRWVN